MAQSNLYSMGTVNLPSGTPGTPSVNQSPTPTVTPAQQQTNYASQNAGTTDPNVRIGGVVGNGLNQQASGNTGASTQLPNVSPNSSANQIQNQNMSGSIPNTPNTPVNSNIPKSALDNTQYAYDKTNQNIQGLQDQIKMYQDQQQGGQGAMLGLMGQSFNYQTQYQKGLETQVSNLQKQQDNVAQYTAQLQGYTNITKESQLALQNDLTTMGSSASTFDEGQQRIERQRAISALSISSLLSASQGNQAVAQNALSAYVQAKYDPYLSQIQNMQSYLSVNQAQLQRLDTKAYQQQTIAMDFAIKGLDYQRANDLSIQTLALNAAANHADPTLVNQIRQAQTPAQAAMLAKDFGIAPADRLQMGWQGQTYYNKLTGQEIDPGTGQPKATTSGGTNWVNYNGGGDKDYLSKITPVVAQFQGATTPEIMATLFQRKTPNSMFSNPQNTAAIFASASKAGVSPIDVAAAISHESVDGTSNVAMNNNNFGGVLYVPTSDIQKSAGAIQGTARPAAEGGYYAKFPTAGQGIDALAKTIALHQGGQSSGSVGTQTPSSANMSIFSNVPIPANTNSTVRGLLRGDDPRNITEKARQSYINQASAIDPSYDSGRYEANQKLKSSFKTGTESDQIVAANTAIMHIGLLEDSFKKLDTAGFQPFGYLENKYKGFVGDKFLDRTNTEINAVTKELEKVYAGSSGGNMEEFKAWKSTLSPNMSYDRAKYAIQTGLELLGGKTSSLNDKYKAATGQDYDVFSANSKRVLNQFGFSVNGGNLSKDTAPESKQSGVVNGTTYVLGSDGLYHKQ